jgi:hypothetical protein
MSLQRVFRVTEVFTTAAALLFAVTSVGMCQAASTQEVEPASSDKMDEIIVYGDKSLRRLRSDVVKAEQKAIIIFNSLNSDDEFDIHCTREAPTGSHIKRHVCRANFVGKATAHEARGFMLGQPYIPAWAEIKRKDELLRKEMDALISENAELFEAFSDLSDAKQILESEHKRRCEGRFLICRR